MRGPRRLLRFVATRLDPSGLDRDTREELESHIALYADALERQGIPRDEAMRRARAEFGGVQRYREEGREVRAFSWLHDLISDLRYGARALRRSPGFAIVCVASLGLGIGANTAIFGLLYGILLQPLHVPNPGELAVVAVRVGKDSYANMRRDDYLALRAAPGLPRLEAVNEANDIAVETNAVHDFAPIAYVEGGFFDLIEVRPTLGRLITPDDDRAASSVVVISDAVWEKFFGRDRSALGSQLRLRGQPFTVIGVMPPTYHGVRFNGSFGLAVPQSAGSLLETQSFRSYVYILSRIEPGASRAGSSAALDAALHRCCLDARERDASSRRASFVDASRGVPFVKDDFRDDYRMVLWLLMGGVGLVLLIACSNVGNLLLARAAFRERELAVRRSIGASRGRIVRQLLAESVLLATLGGATGLLLAAAGNKVLVSALPSGVASSSALIEFHVNAVMLSFTAGVSALCVVAFGLGPALRATRGDLVSSLKERSARANNGRASRVDRALVVGQVALTLVLVCGAGLLVATLENLRSIDPGFRADHLLAVNIETRGTAFEREGIVPIQNDILERIRRVPGVLRAGMATRIPAVGGRNASQSYAVPGAPVAPAPDDELDVTVVTPGYFAAAGASLLGGRDVATSDTPANTLVAVVNDAFARRHFPGKSPIGAQVRLGDATTGRTLSIVGVVNDMRFGDRRTKQDPMIYIPAAQAGKWPFMIALIRSNGDARALETATQRAIADYSPSLRLLRWQTMEEAFDEVLLRERLAAGLSSLCAALALGLAMVGLSGLVGYGVARRTREIGVRMALGARGSGVVWLVLRGALTLVVGGIVAGMPLALVAARGLGSLLYGIGAANPLVLLVAGVSLLAASAAASAIPAWRASRVDPVTALRAD